VTGSISVVDFEPDEPTLYTFGGAEPVAMIGPGQVLRTVTEDCFGGAVLTVDDLPSKVCEQFNPVTGPFYVQGAEYGDTLAVHVIALDPARDWGMSATFPHTSGR
jgi:acetamidase/formamidase